MSRRRGVSGLGLMLVLVGAVILAVSFSILPRDVYELWPLILVGVGVMGLFRRPGWIQELDFAMPGAGEALRRPRRGFSWFLIGGGLLLLLITTHLVDSRLIGPAILIALGLLLLWRRSH
jgi:membrane protease YdiL (CAAX protease family)